VRLRTDFNMAAAMRALYSAIATAGQQMMYVFCARGEAKICFSLSDNPSCLPPLPSGEQWRALFRIPKDAASIDSFRIDGKHALAEVDARGFCIATPAPIVIPFRRTLADGNA
jgi:hypothetical protein